MAETSLDSELNSLKSERKVNTNIEWNFSKSTHTLSAENETEKKLSLSQE